MRQKQPITPAYVAPILTFSPVVSDPSRGDTCPRHDCLAHRKESKIRTTSTKFGFYKRQSDGVKVRRYRCLQCGRTFSSATSDPFSGHKKRWSHHLIERSLVSGVSQRRCAMNIGIGRKSLVKKFIILAQVARQKNQDYLEKYYAEKKIQTLDFDEMESSIHSKLLPVSIPIAVDQETRKIIGLGVCFMPAKGKMAHISRKKYGLRADDRIKLLDELFKSIKTWIDPKALLKSDACPRYPRIVKLHLRACTHQTFVSRKACVVGQGELKRGGFDPLFSINHSAAMIRANVNRLFRRTWNTSKKMERLADHLALYVYFHNSELTPSNNIRRGQF